MLHIQKSLDFYMLVQELKTNPSNEALLWSATLAVGLWGFRQRLPWLGLLARWDAGGLSLVQKALVMVNVPQLRALVPDSLLNLFPASSLAFSSRFQHTECTFIYQHWSNNLSLKKWRQSIKCTTGNPSSHMHSETLSPDWHLTTFPTLGISQGLGCDW